MPIRFGHLFPDRLGDLARLAAESPRGRNDLYVALTRATRRLGVLRSGEPGTGVTGR